MLSLSTLFASHHRGAFLPIYFAASIFFLRFFVARLEIDSLRGRLALPLSAEMPQFAMLVDDGLTAKAVLENVVFDYSVLVPNAKIFHLLFVVLPMLLGVIFQKLSSCGNV